MFFFHIDEWFSSTFYKVRHTTRPFVCEMTLDHCRGREPCPSWPAIWGPVLLYIRAYTQYRILHVYGGVQRRVHTHRCTNTLTFYVSISISLSLATFAWRRGAKYGFIRKHWRNKKAHVTIYSYLKRSDFIWNFYCPNRMHVNLSLNLKSNNTVRVTKLPFEKLTRMWN